MCKTRSSRPSKQAEHRLSNKKQYSRQLQCEVPCDVGNVIDSSLSSLSSTGHAVHRGGGPASGRGEGGLVGEGGLAGGGGQDIFQSSCHILHYHMVLCPKGTSHNQNCWQDLCRAQPLSSLEECLRILAERSEVDYSYHKTPGQVQTVFSRFHRDSVRVQLWLVSLRSTTSGSLWLGKCAISKCFQRRMTHLCRQCGSRLKFS